LTAAAVRCSGLFGCIPTCPLVDSGDDKAEDKAGNSSQDRQNGRCTQESSPLAGARLTGTDKQPASEHETDTKSESTAYQRHRPTDKPCRWVPHLCFPERRRL